MVKLSCQCGQIRIEIARKPDFINACNCTFCSKAGACWGYLHPSEVTVQGAARGYRRQDKPEPAAELKFCGECGSATHFRLTERAVARFGDVQMGVNMRLAEPCALAGIELRFPDGRSWDGAGAFGYVREARILGQ